MFKIGVLSDTHLHRVTDNLKELFKKEFKDIDVLVHAGDMTAINVYDYLKNWDIRAVRGNMDDYELQSIIPKKRIEVINDRKFGIIHGYGSPYGIEDRVRAEFDDVDVIVFGHSHVPVKIEINGVVLFNPGSFGYSGSAGIIEIGDRINFSFINTR